MYRKFSGKQLKIDGRDIDYDLVTALDYLVAKNVDGLGEIEDEDDFECAIEEWEEKNYHIYERITQIMALKQSCYLLRRTSHSCGSLSDGLYHLKNELIAELETKFNFIFDDDFVENFKSPYLV